MIREMGNVELFELRETIPKVQSSDCILHWNQGIVYCTCGHLLVGSESSQNFHRWRLDALSIPHYVTRKGRPRGARHGKTEAQKQHFLAHNARRRCIKKNFDGIHDRFQRDSVYRDSQLKIGWTRQKCTDETPIRLPNGGSGMKTGGAHNYCLKKFVVARSFTADGNLLQPTGCLNRTPSHVTFSPVSQHTHCSVPIWRVGHGQRNHRRR